jgi:hypothetical protein
MDGCVDGFDGKGDMTLLPPGSAGGGYSAGLFANDCYEEEVIYLPCIRYLVYLIYGIPHMV